MAKRNICAMCQTRVSPASCRAVCLCARLTEMQSDLGRWGEGANKYVQCVQNGKMIPTKRQTYGQCASVFSASKCGSICLRRINLSVSLSCSQSVCLTAA